MFQQQVYILNNILMAFDALCIIAASYCSYYVNVFLLGNMPISGHVFLISTIAVMFINNYSMGSFDLYSEKKPPGILKLVGQIFKAVLIVFLFFSTAILILDIETYTRSYVVVFCLSSFVLIAAERLLVMSVAGRLSSTDFNARKILVVGDLERGRIVSDILARQLSWGHKVVGRLAIGPEDGGNGNTLGSIDQLADVLRSVAIDEVVFAVQGDRNIDLLRPLEICRDIGVPARILPAMWRPGNRMFSMENLQGVPFLNVHADNFNATGLLYKRLLDLAGGLVGVVILLIIYPFVALAIKLDSAGPVLFVQPRKGKHGRVFNLYKFRTMYANAEEMKKELMARNEMNGAMFKMQDDPRITRVGRWLRSTSLDEFPQFINVLKGEMSLVGTRPPTVDEVGEYELRHLKRIASKPGITGLWQVSGRNKINDFEEVVKLDCRYLDNWRFSDDINILFKTLWVVLQRKGAV